MSAPNSPVHLPPPFQDAELLHFFSEGGPTGEISTETSPSIGSPPLPLAPHHPLPAQQGAHEEREAWCEQPLGNMPRTHNPCIRRAANWKVAVCNYCALGQLDRALACCFKRIVYLSSLGEKQCLKAKRTCLDWYFRLLSDLGQQDTLLPQIANVNAQLHAVMALDRLEKGQLGYFKRHMQRTADLEPAALELFQQRIGLPPAVNAVALLGEL